MKKSLIPLIAVACLAMTAARAAEPQVLKPPNRYSAAHARVMATVSRHHIAVSLETAAIPVDPAFNVHVAPWRSFDVPADWTDAVTCTSHGMLLHPEDQLVLFNAANANLLGTVVAFSVEPNSTTVDGYVRFADGALILADARRGSAANGRVDYQ